MKIGATAVALTLAALFALLAVPASFGPTGVAAAVSGATATTCQDTGSILSSTTWDSTCVHVVTGVRVQNGATLTIGPGTIVKVSDSLVAAGLGAQLIVNGTALQPVSITSIRDDSVGGDTNGDGASTSPAAGDWQEIGAGDGGALFIDHANIRFGGGATGTPGDPQAEVLVGPNSSASLQLSASTVESSAGLGIASIFSGGVLTITDSSIRGNAIYGMYVVNAGSLSVDRTSISGNVGFGVYAQNTAVTVTNSTFGTNDYGLGVDPRTAPAPTITNNVFAGNRLYGVYAYAPLSAVSNYWGAADGPASDGSTCNTALGSGDRVNCGVSFSPWLSAIPSSGPGLIAFVVGDGSSPGLYVERPDGTDRQLVVAGDVQDPRWSPDGRKIAYLDPLDRMLKVVQLSDRSVRSLVCAGTGSGPVYGGRGSDLHFWSPDSTMVAVGNPCVIGMVVANTNTGMTSTIPDGFLPNWTPLASQLLFICASTPAGSALCTADPTGANRTAIPVPAFGIQGTASYSSNGGRIVVPLVVSGGALYLAVMDADGANFRGITTDFSYSNYLYSVPAWSPTDPHRIAYAVNGGGTELLNVDTLVKSNFPAGVSHQPWSPDGSKLVADAGGDLYLLDAATGTTTRIAQTPETEYQPAWGIDAGLLMPPVSVDLTRSSISINPSSVSVDCPGTENTIRIALVGTDGKPYTPSTTVAVRSDRGAADTLPGSPATIIGGTAIFSICSDTPGVATVSATADGRQLSSTATETFTLTCPHARLISTIDATGVPSIVWGKISHYRDLCIKAPTLVQTNGSPYPIDLQRPLTVQAFGSSHPLHTDFLLWKAKTRKSGAAHQIPIVLVHGIGGEVESHSGDVNPLLNDPAWNTLTASLISNGYRVYAISFSVPWGSIEPEASALGDALREVRRDAGSNRVDVIAHSMGGLATRFYMEGLASDSGNPYQDDVRNFVMLGTPNGGWDQIFRHPQLAGSLVALFGSVQPSPWTNDATLGGARWISVGSGKYDGLLEMLKPQTAVTHCKPGDGLKLGSVLICVTSAETREWIQSAYSGSPASVQSPDAKTTFHAFGSGLLSAESLGGRFIDVLSGGVMPADSRYLLIAGTNNCMGPALICVRTMEQPSDGVVFKASVFDVRLPSPTCGTADANHVTLPRAAAVITRVVQFLQRNDAEPKPGRAYSTC